VPSIEKKKAFRDGGKIGRYTGKAEEKQAKQGKKVVQKRSGTDRTRAS